MLAAFLHRSDDLTESLFTGRLIQHHPAFDHFQLQQISKYTLYIERLKECMFFETFPLQKDHFLLSNNQLRFLSNTPEIRQIIHRVPQPEIPGIGCTKRLGYFIISDDIPGFIETMFTAGNSGQHIVDIQI